MCRQVAGSALYRPDNPVEHVLATDAVAVDIDSQGIGIQWNDCLGHAAVAILRNVYAAAGGDATVLLIETVLPDHDRDFPGKWADLEMPLLGSSRERTAAEYRELLGQAGLRMTRVVQTASPYSVVEAKPA